MTFIQIVAIYTRRHSIRLLLCTRYASFQHSTVLYTQIMIYIYARRGAPCSFPNLPLLPLLSLLVPFVPLSTYLRPPVVTGIVLPLPRLLVNWPYLPPLNPIIPPSPTSHNPNCPTPDNDDIGTAPLWLCGTDIKQIKLLFILVNPWSCVVIFLSLSLTGQVPPRWQVAIQWI
jgi:hypothetical protein